MRLILTCSIKFVEQSFCKGRSCNKYKLGKGWRGSTLTTLAFPNSHIVPLSISLTTQIAQTTDIGLKTCSPLLLGLAGSVCLAALSYPKWVVCSLTSESWVCYFIFIIPKFWRRNSKDLITRLQILRLVYEFLLFLFCFIVEMSRSKRGVSNDITILPT